MKTIKFPGRGDGEHSAEYLVTWVNTSKPMPCPDPHTPEQGVSTNKTAGIQKGLWSEPTGNTPQ